MSSKSSAPALREEVFGRAGIVQAGGFVTFTDMTTHLDRQFLTPASLAACLGISENTLKALREDPASGFPAPRMIGRLPRWRLVDVDAWVGAPALEQVTAVTVATGNGRPSASTDVVVPKRKSNVPK